MKAKIINKKVLLNKKTIYCGDKNVHSIAFEIPSEIDKINLNELTPIDALNILVKIKEKIK